MDYIPGIYFLRSATRTHTRLRFAASSTACPPFAHQPQVQGWRSPGTHLTPAAAKCCWPGPASSDEHPAQVLGRPQRKKMVEVDTPRYPQVTPRPGLAAPGRGFSTSHRSQYCPMYGVDGAGLRPLRRTAKYRRLWARRPAPRSAGGAAPAPAPPLPRPPPPPGPHPPTPAAAGRLRARRRGARAAERPGLERRRGASPGGACT